MAKGNYSGLDMHQQAFIKTLRQVATNRRAHEVFRDFCELSALSFSNAVDRGQFDAREARYMEIVAGYTSKQVGLFPLMLAHLTESLSLGFHDALGEIFGALELHSQWHGQFFTPYPVAALMAQLTMPCGPEELPACGFITVCEPAAGAGAMVIAAAEALLSGKVNYQQCMHVTATDVEPTAAHMAYVQFSLLHIPAIVLHGNSLSLETWSHWVTPAHVLGFWDLKLRRSRETSPVIEAATLAPSTLVTGLAITPDQIGSVRERIVSDRISSGAQLGLFE
ncbi:N-6 DNA methylase [Zoogloeaceae bacterium G21618-S1]|nr:N-6 DNA methylase [Zoogloeaceae bacterium G21618-S1]